MKAQQKISLLLYFVFALSLVMCAREPSARSEKQPLNPGEISGHISCSSDTTLTYALFIPSDYDSQKTWPLIIGFDPHGDGLIPVNLFKKDAETHGYIIAGSNSSRNGMSIEQTNRICSFLIDDLKSRFKIDEKSIYLAGFSGGSRVAGSFAIQSGNIAGVIGIGAGLSRNIAQFPPALSYLAIAGTFDFNYSELYNLDQSLEQGGMVHHFIEYDGSHAWPPSNLIPEIFTWTDFDRMRKGSRPVNRVLINQFIDRQYTVYEDFKKKGMYFEAYKILVTLKHYLNKLTDTEPIQDEIADLLKQEKVKSELNTRESVFQQEIRLQSSYSQQLQTESLDYWKQKVKEIKTASEMTPIDDGVRMQKRLLGFLSLSAYSISNRWLAQNQPGQAEHYIELYRIIDPENAEHRYMAAQLAMKQNMNDRAIKELQNAINLGFTDKKRIAADPLFTSLHSNPEFRNLIK